MARRRPDFLAVGTIAKAHGTRGEVLVTSLTDHPEDMFVPGVVLRMGGPERDQPDPDLPPLRVDTVRPANAGFLVQFRGVDDRDTARRLRGYDLYVPADAVRPLAEDELFLHDLVGLEVRTVSGEVVGRVGEVYEMSPAHLLGVEAGGREILIPYVREIVVEVEPAEGVLVVDPPEGLLDL